LPAPLSRLFAAADALETRLAATPPSPSVSDPAGSPEPATATQLDAAALASALVRLACPSVAFPVLARRPASLVAGLAAPVGAELADWLGAVATVRPRLAVHDADQLGVRPGDQPLVARLDRPGDVWQQLGVPADGATSLTVAFGPDGAFTGPPDLAVGEVDRFAEAVPFVRSATALGGEERVLTAAVGFNAPAARAPQAILLAVAPALADDLGPEVIFSIVAEVRQSAHARMARGNDLGAAAAALPATWIPKAWVSGVELTADREV
jgi:hypothetical protein